MRALDLAGFPPENRSVTVHGAAMTVKVLGLNHKTAPVALREKVAFNEDRLVAALRTLRAEKGVAEVLILSTCNRTELYWSGQASGEDLSQWLEHHHGGLELAS